MYRPTPIEQLAILAKLNMLLGRHEYDRLFLQFECLGVDAGIADVFVRNEYQAVQIDSNYHVHVAIAVESVIKRAVKSVNVLPRYCTDSKA